MPVEITGAGLKFSPTLAHTPLPYLHHVTENKNLMTINPFTSTP
jgi:hypothetical protein